MQLNQISCLSSGQTLDTYLVHLNEKVVIFGGQINDVSDLNSLTPVLDQHVFVKEDNKWVRYNGLSWDTEI